MGVSYEEWDLGGTRRNSGKLKKEMASRMGRNTDERMVSRTERITDGKKGEVKRREAKGEERGRGKRKMLTQGREGAKGAGEGVGFGWG
jgi:hypothetical protein